MTRISIPEAALKKGKQGLHEPHVRFREVPEGFMPPSAGPETEKPAYTLEDIANLRRDIATAATENEYGAIRVAQGPWKLFFEGISLAYRTAYEAHCSTLQAQRDYLALRVGLCASVASAALYVVGGAPIAFLMSELIAQAIRGSDSSATSFLGDGGNDGAAYVNAMGQGAIGQAVAIVKGQVEGVMGRRMNAWLKSCELDIDPRKMPIKMRSMAIRWEQVCDELMRNMSRKYGTTAEQRALLDRVHWETQAVGAALVEQARVVAVGQIRWQLMVMRHLLTFPESLRPYTGSIDDYDRLALELERRIWAQWILEHKIGVVPETRFNPLRQRPSLPKKVSERLHELGVIDLASRVPKILRGKDFKKYGVGKNEASVHLSAWRFGGDELVALRNWAVDYAENPSIFFDLPSRTPIVELARSGLFGPSFKPPDAGSPNLFMLGSPQWSPSRG